MASQSNIDLDEVQKQIIDSKALSEVQKSQLVSFAKYLNLPWDDLEAFKIVVKSYEAEFTEKLSQIEESNRTKFYINNYPFHIFNNHITESPKKLQKISNLQMILDASVELLHQKDWKFLKDEKGNDMNSYQTYLFLQEITIRIFKWNYLVTKKMPLGERGCTPRRSSQTGTNEYLPRSDVTKFEMASIEDFSSNRFELYLLNFKPQVVVLNKSDNVTSSFVDLYHDLVPRSSGRVVEFLRLHVLEEIKDLFDKTILPDMKDGFGLLFYDGSYDPSLRPEPSPKVSGHYEYRKYHEMKTRIGSSEKFEYTTDITETSDSKKRKTGTLDMVKLLNERVLSNFEKPDLKIEIYPKTNEEKSTCTSSTLLNEKVHTLCTFSVKFETDLAELCKHYFEKLEGQMGSSGEFYVDGSVENKRRKVIHETQDVSQIGNELENWSTSNHDQIDNHVEKRTKIEYKGQEIRTSHESRMDSQRIHRYIEEATNDCKSCGTPLSIITNGDDYILLYIENFYEKLRLKTDVYSEWQVFIISRDEQPLLSVFTSILMHLIHEYITNDCITNSEVTNWYQTDGSCDRKQILDMNRYLITRKLLSTLLYEKTDLKLETSKDLLKFTWCQDSELHKSFQSKGITKMLNKFINNTIKFILKSPTWKTLKFMIPQVFSEKFSFLKIELLESTDFTILKTLKNETWGKEVSSTVIHGKYNNDETEGVVKFFDVNRMNIDDDWSVSLTNKDKFKPTFTNLLYFCFRSFMNEFIAYLLIGEEDFVPKVLRCGYLSMSELKPDSSVKDFKLYEDPFVHHLEEGFERKLLTESPFFYFEHIPKLEIEDMIPIDFEKLKDQALADLEKLHMTGVRHRNICHKNIIIKKSDKSKIGYRVVFIGFSLSVVHKDEIKVSKGFKEEIIEERKSFLNALGKLEEDKMDLKNSVYYYRDLVQNKIKENRKEDN